MPKDSEGKETGSISKWALQEECITADDMGRKVIQNGYVTLPKLDAPVAKKVEKGVISDPAGEMKAVKSVHLDEAQEEFVFEV